MMASSALSRHDGESVLVVPQIRVHRAGSVMSQNQPEKPIPKSSPARNNKKRSASTSEGHRTDLATTSNESTSCVCGSSECSCVQGSLAEVTHSTMERAVIGTSYISDYEDESLSSDSENDHTDSSDDDDPKSQVDRMIEKGTLLFMEEVNSALSSEGESDDGDSSDYDSDSDITDVSPILSATASPLGLSPVLQRRAKPTSPLVLNENIDLQLDYRGPRSRKRPESPCFLPRPCDNRGTTNMDLLMKAVLEIDKSHAKNNNKQTDNDDDVFIDPIRANPHHRHLRKPHRKNMSFSNEDVRNIDRTNKILLKKIMAVHSRTKSNLHPNSATCEQSYPSFSSYSKRKEDERIRRNNLIMLRKIQGAKPTPQLMVRRTLSGPTV